MLDNIDEKTPDSVSPPASQPFPRPVPRLVPRSSSEVGSSKSEVGSLAVPRGEALRSGGEVGLPEINATEDIFGGTKEVLPPMTNQPKSPGAIVPPAMKREIVSIETPRQGFKKILIIAVAVVIFAGILGFGGYWVYNNVLKSKPLSPNLNINTPPPEEAQQVETPAPETVAPVPVDSDNDGLVDSEEVRLGTDALNPDTDGDRLFDGEEANVYLTDPLNKDTDGDGFEDGSEVQKGYDPKGPGKLIRIPVGQ